jgi:hypothetical protein
LLFSGVIVKFDRLHKNTLSSYEYVPIIGEMMAARWSFEALAVEQFKNNKYERNFFKYNMEISQNDWYSAFLINALKIDLKECIAFKDSLPYRQIVTKDFNKLNYYIDKLNRLSGFGAIKGNWKSSLNTGKFNSESAKETGKYLDSLSGYFRQVRKTYWDKRDLVTKSIQDKISKEGLVMLKNNYYNKNLEDLVLDRYRVDKYVETDNRIIQKMEPGYMKPDSRLGRAHFYAPYKQIGDIKIDTYWFNLMVLWLVTMVLYIALYYNLLEKMITVLSNLRLKESESKRII